MGEACKGGSQFTYGHGRGIAVYSGYPDSCDQATFNLPPDAQRTIGIGFSCTGWGCPASAPRAFSNIYPTEKPTPAPTPRPTTPYPTAPTKTPTTPAPHTPWCCKTRLVNFTPWNG